MLFNVEQDQGSRIVAYVVPDSAGTTPSIVLRSGGAEVLTLEANEVRPNLVAAGRHATGRCGFVIDEHVLPGLQALHDLEIAEASQDVMVYRRRPSAATDLSIFRLETHLLPLWRLDEALKGRFQFWYKGVERLGLETSTQVFCINDARSCYVSGRLLYKNFEVYLAKGVTTVGIIRDPYYELAERLILLRNIGSRAGEILGERDAMAYSHLIEALAGVEEFDDAFCKRFFRRAPIEAVVTLSNPLVRQLTVGTPDEMPSSTSVATALEALAAFDVLGLRSDPETFVSTLGEVVGMDPTSIPDMKEYPRIIELGERLRKIHDIEALLEKDLEVFRVITRAYEAVHA